MKELLLKIITSNACQKIAAHPKIGARLSRRFVAGETMDDVLIAVNRLNSEGKKATVDFLGEAVSEPADTTKSVTEYENLLTAIKKEALDANISLKLTQLGLAFDPKLAKSNLQSIVDYAASLDNFVRIDMEGSAYTQPTLDIFYGLFRDYKNLGAVIQSALVRSKDDTEMLIDAGAKVRLCKGAYREPVDIAYQQKVDVDLNYVILAERLIKDGNYPAIATHDPRILEITTRLARYLNKTPQQFELQMLYGVRRDLQTQYVSEGNKVRIYVPYGTKWYPYLIRRLAERPANLLFLLGNLLREAKNAS